jgi:hypothetical protein
MGDKGKKGGKKFKKGFIDGLIEKALHVNQVQWDEYQRDKVQKDQESRDKWVNKKKGKDNGTGKRT